MAWTSLCDYEELAEGVGKYVEIDGYRLAVFLNGGEVYVMDNACPHAGGSMSAGWVDEGCAVCPWHGWAFGLKDGELRGALEPGGFKIGTYAVRLLERTGKPTLVQADLRMP